MAIVSPVRSERVAGSFRDPSGYVFKRNDRLFRAIDADCRQVLHELRVAGVLGELMDRYGLVRTWFVEEPDLRRELAGEHPGFEHFLEHEILAPITYPYEWSFSMLADAALHTLDLQERLVRAGCSLKDASAYNIQFVHGTPRFIDLPSIERPARLDLWYALGQFGRMFTVPLLLCRHQGWDLPSYFLASIDGRDLEQVARGLHWLGRWRPRWLLDVTLPLLLGRKANRQEGTGRELLEQRRNDPAAQLFSLARLRRKIRKLTAGYRTGGAWSDYTATCSYTDRSEQGKKEMVRRFLESARPGCVLDAGCNTGDYSFLAAACGAQVIAADADHDAVEQLYRRLKTHPAAITPVVVNLANPSPAIGFRNRERTRFVDRLDADCVLALALLHHLLVSANLSLPAIRDFLAELTKTYLVLEFVPTADVQFQRLLKFRHNRFGDLTLDQCRAVFAERFELLREEPVPDSPRTLWFWRKKS